MNNDTPLVLGICVTETLTISFGRYHNGNLEFAEEPVRREFKESNIVDSVAAGLKELFDINDLKATISKVGSIVLSTFGAVDNKRKRLIEIPRKAPPLSTIIPMNPDDPGVDLREIIKNAIPNIPDEALLDHRFHVLNDTTTCAIGERFCGAGKDLAVPDHDETFAFVWLGDGVNAGILSGGKPWRGRLHPEFGHIRGPGFLNRNTKNNVQEYAGECRYHQNCLEGMLCRTALLSQWGMEENANLNDLWESEPTHATEYFVGGVVYMCAIITSLISPTRIVLGGASIRSVDSFLGAQHEKKRLFLKKVEQGFLEEFTYAPEGSKEHRGKGFPFYNELLEPDFLSLGTLEEDAHMQGALYYGVLSLAQELA